jgi:sugar phosphate isomerase/epimerase
MLNYAFMSFSCPDLDFEEFAQAARWYGYQGIEPRIEADHAHGLGVNSSAEARQAARRIAADKGVAICCLATSRRLAAADAVELDLTRRCLDLAADLGAPRLRVFGGPLPAGATRADAIQRLAENLSVVAPHAQERGVTLCLETHDDWCNPNHVAAVMEAADHPSVAVNWDVMHPVRTAGWAVADAYRTLKPWIRHVHVHDGTTAQERLTLVPIGQGEIDHRAALACLVADGYPGYLSGEWIAWEPWAIHLPRELHALRVLERDLTEGAAP